MPGFIILRGADMILYLVRHGETEWNEKLLFQGHSNTSLNKNGIDQAKKIAKYFKDKKVDIIYSSDLKRAFDTAKIIKNSLKFKGKIIKSELLRERNYGSLEGKHYNLFFDRKKFDGEKDNVFFSRLKKIFKKILNENNGKNIMVVTHGGVVRAFIAFALNLKDYKRIRIYNASISEIYYDEKKDAFFVVMFNSIEHLSKKDKQKIRLHIKGI